MKALVLAGGFATRMRPLSCSRPKILFPIVNKPLLQWTFERLAKSGISEVVLAVNLQTEFSIRNCRLPRSGLRLKFSRDPSGTPLGTGGPIKKAERLVGQDSPFLVLNGDIFADVDYASIAKEHAKKGGVATIALHKVDDPMRYGVVDLHSDCSVKRFVEKPSRGSAPSNLINAGVYVFSPEIFNYLPEGPAFSLERDVFPVLAKQRLLFGCVFDGLWTDIGKPADYLELNIKLLNSLGIDSQSAWNEAHIRHPVAFDKGVSVGRGSTVGPCAVLGQSVIVGENVHIRNSVIFPAASIGDRTFLEEAIIGEGAVVGCDVKIGKGCVIGDHARICDNVTLAQNVTVCPASEASKSVLTQQRVC